MLYLSQMLGKPVIDAAGSEIGTISDIAIATGEVFPRVTSLAFLGPEKTPFMLSWRKFVDGFDGDGVALNVAAPDLRFSYLQPDEVLLHRDLLNKQIVDTQGKKVVRVNDLKLSESRNQLRLLGAEVGVRGLLRGVSPRLERATERALGLIGGTLPENLIAWNYMDLLDRDLSQVKLSVTHKRLHELHPADVADILEQMGPSQRAAVFQHLDNVQAAEAIAMLEDEYQADVIDDLSERRASDLLAEMDPDDAADVIGDLPYDKAERLLRLMGLEDARAIRGLLGYKEKTAGGIMTPEVTSVTDDMTVVQVIEHLRSIAEEQESIYYVYVVEDDRRLTGVISLRDLLLASPETTVADLAERDLFTSAPDDDQEDVAEQMSKYDLLALPVVDESGRLLGMVTVDDALDVLEEEAQEDLALATGGSGAERGRAFSVGSWIIRRSWWAVIWVVALVGAIQAAGNVTDPNAGPVPEWAVLVPTYIVWAAILLPIVLRTGEESSSRAIAELIDPTEEIERRGLGPRILRDALLGLVVAVIVGVVAFVFAEAFLQAEEPRAAFTFSVATALAVLATFLFGALMGERARRRAEADRPVSSTSLSASAMLFGTVVYFALAIAASAIAAQFLG